MDVMKPGFAEACVMWALMVCFQFAQFFIQTSGNTMGALWQSDFNLSAASLGMLSSIFFYAYVLVQIIAGFLYDEWGAKRVVRLSLLLFAAGLLLFASSHSFLTALIARILMGVSAGFSFVGMVYVAANWFSPTLFILFVGLGEMLSMLFTSIAQWWAPHFIMIFGWRPLIAGLGIGVLILFGLTWWIMKNPPHFSASSRPLFKSFWQQFIAVLKMPVVWLAGIICGGMFGVITVFASLWGSFFFEAAYGLSYLNATHLIAFVPLGLALGSPLFGLINNRYLSTFSIVLWVSISLILLASLILFGVFPLHFIILLLFLLGLGGGCNVLAFYIVGHAVAPSRRGISSGLCNAIAILLGTLFQSIIGVLWQYLHLHLMNPAVIAKWAMLPFLISLIFTLMAVVTLKYKQAKGF